MNAAPNFALEGYEDAPHRKLLAYFRPWIEDRQVLLFGSDPLAADYVQALAATGAEGDKVDFVFAPGVSTAELHKASTEAKRLGAAFAGWSFEEAEIDGECLFQSPDWPFALSKEGGLKIWVRNGELEPIRHPSIGIAIPTHRHHRAALEAIAAYAAEYPGEIRFALVANGIESAAKKEIANSPFTRAIDLVEFEENQGYGKGCNAGLAALLEHKDLDFIGVSNDDVLPGTDCIYELVHAMSELARLGLNPGGIGPVSNEVNGAQRMDLGTFDSAREVRQKGHAHWRENKSGANETFQLRGLLLLWSRKCLEAVGGFDPRFGIGNFEDDDHNIRTRLAGFTLWIATGAFLFHHGSSTFKSLKVDYEANIRRNSELLIRKWGLEKLEDWPSLTEVPKGTSLFQPFESDLKTDHVIKINGEKIDLIHQASDIEFAAWVMGHPSSRTPEGRTALVEVLSRAA